MGPFTQLSDHRRVILVFGIQFLLLAVSFTAAQEPEALPEPFVIAVEAQRDGLPEPFKITVKAERKGLPEPYEITVKAERADLPDPFEITVEAEREDLPEPFEITVEADRADLPEPFEITVEAEREDLPDPFEIMVEAEREDLPEPFEIMVEAEREDLPDPFEITVSAERKELRVPDVRGLNPEAASRRLSEVYLRPGRLPALGDPAPEEHAPGTVQVTRPAHGVQADPDSEVTLVLWAQRLEPQPEIEPGPHAVEASAAPELDCSRRMPGSEKIFSPGQGLVCDCPAGTRKVFDGSGNPLCICPDGWPPPPSGCAEPTRELDCSDYPGSRKVFDGASGEMICVCPDGSRVDDLIRRCPEEPPAIAPPQVTGTPAAPDRCARFSAMLQTARSAGQALAVIRQAQAAGCHPSSQLLAQVEQWAQQEQNIENQQQQQQQAQNQAAFLNLIAGLAQTLQNQQQQGSSPSPNAGPFGGMPVPGTLPGGNDPLNSGGYGSPGSVAGGSSTGAGSGSGCLQLTIRKGQPSSGMGGRIGQKYEYKCGSLDVKLKNTCSVSIEVEGNCHWALGHDPRGYKDSRRRFRLSPGETATWLATGVCESKHVSSTVRCSGTVTAGSQRQSFNQSG